MYNGSNFTVAQKSAIAIGTQNGYTITSSQVTSPRTGYVAVSVTGSQPRFFSGLWGSGTMSVTASTVARGVSTPYSTAALLVLASSGSSVTLSGTTQVTAVNGSIVVDSTSSSSIVSSGSPSITTPELDLSGGSFSRDPIPIRPRSRITVSRIPPTRWRVSRLPAPQV